MNDNSKTVSMTVAETRCLLCGGGTFATVLDGVTDTRFGAPGLFRIARCETCGLEQTLPRPSPEELGRLYRDHYNYGGERGTAYTAARRFVFDSGLYRLWMRLDGDVSFYDRKGGGRLIDIGCNEGRGLGWYRANGFAAEGLETNPVAAAAARALGFPVHAVELARFQPSAPYDVAVLSNVLEHFLDPRAALRDIRRILKPGGELWVSCPNSESWLRHAAGRAWINWHVPFHIAHFSTATLARLLQEQGFTVTEHRQATPALWVAHTAIARLFARPGRTNRALRRPLLVLISTLLARGLGFAYLDLQDRRGKGDCHLLVARRVD